MLPKTDDLRIEALRPLLPPAILLEEIPLTPVMAQTVADARIAAARIVHGQDDRLLVIVGPCSIHDVEAARAYGERLRAVARQHAADLQLVMRVYFEKPRTTVGWKGLVNDPTMDERFLINHGLRQARALLADLAAIGVPAGTEFLDTISPQFLADLVAWGAIGARTAESQVHRELASGLSMPVGFKNGTSGNLQVALDAVRAAAHPHHFLSVTKQGIAAIVATRGNLDCHLILRGGANGPNYRPAEVDAVLQAQHTSGIASGLMIDCSHGNSGKDHTRQPAVAREVGAQIAAGNRHIVGVMLESNLVAGRQDWGMDPTPTFGQSITDACIGWDDTVGVLEQLAADVRSRRVHRAPAPEPTTLTGV